MSSLPKPAQSRAGRGAAWIGWSSLVASLAGGASAIAGAMLGPAQGLVWLALGAGLGAVGAGLAALGMARGWDTSWRTLAGLMAGSITAVGAGLITLSTLIGQ